jgi:hypothetical protein
MRGRGKCGDPCAAQVTAELFAAMAEQEAFGQYRRRPCSNIIDPRLLRDIEDRREAAHARTGSARPDRVNATARPAMNGCSFLLWISCFL